jgi:hypothetical protein
MAGTRRKTALAGALVLIAVGATTANAGGGAGGGNAERARLSSLSEVPTLSTAGNGAFRARVNTRTDRIRYTLTYRRMSGNVQQAHIHLGRSGTNGGVSAFLCSNLAGAPAGTPACPRRRGSVSGIVRPARVVGPTDQGIDAGQFGELVRAIRAGATYVNVHTVPFTTGEIRGQIR